MDTIKEKMVGSSQKQKTPKRSGKNTQRNYNRKIWMSQTNTDSVVSDLEPDILESEKWALESMGNNKASGGDSIPVKLFKILKYDVVICQQVWKTQQWPEDWKRSVYIPTPKKGIAKECSNYTLARLCSKSYK